MQTDTKKLLILKCFPIEVIPEDPVMSFLTEVRTRYENRIGEIGRLMDEGKIRLDYDISIVTCFPHEMREIVKAAKPDKLCVLIFVEDIKKIYYMYHRDIEYYNPKYLLISYSFEICNNFVSWLPKIKDTSLFHNNQAPYYYFDLTTMDLDNEGVNEYCGSTALRFITELLKNEAYDYDMY